MTLYAVHMQNLDLPWECLIGLWYMQKTWLLSRIGRLRYRYPYSLHSKLDFIPAIDHYVICSLHAKFGPSMITFTRPMVAPKNCPTRDRTITLQVPLFITFILRLYWNIYSPGNQQSLCKRSTLLDETTICYDFLKMKKILLRHPITRSICRPFFFDFIYDSLCL